jgi:hypothetical protein
MTAIPLHAGRKAQIWRAGGMIWLISVTFFFALLDLYFAKLQTLQTISIGTAVLVITIVLFVRSIKSLQLSKKLPIENSNNFKNGSSIKKWFLIILSIEIVALNIATLILLKTNHFEYIVPVDILIVSLHFIPLGRIFAISGYYLLGIIVSVIVVLTLLLVPASSHIGNLISIAAIPSLCFVFLNWFVIIFIHQDSMKYFKV